MKIEFIKPRKRRTELSQSITRVALLVFCSIVMAVMHYIDSSIVNLSLAMWVQSMYLIYSLGIYFLVKKNPQFTTWRVVLTTTTDFAILSYGIYIGNEYGAIIFPLFLWTIIAAGLRFGVPYLIFSMFNGIVLFSVAIFYSNYWHQNLVIALGQLIGMAMLPLFYALILRELEATNLNLIKQKEFAEQANVAKSRFLAAASHDLRQPLQAQTLFVADLYERLHDRTRSLSILSKLDDSIKAMSEQFDALLDISKLDAGVVQPNIKHFKINALLCLLKNEYKQLAKSKGLELRMRCRDVTVYTDPGLLDSVLRNLVVNAIRYTTSGKILIGCRLHSDSVTLQVLDTGSGIEKVHIDDIFQEFFQVDNPSRDRDQGLGLGLSVVSRIANLLGCPLNVISTVGKGSCFSIDLPLGDADAILPELEISPIGKEHVLDGMQVIVIDDETAIQEAMGSLLESWGCNVLIAGNGEDALIKLSESNMRPDIIVVDYRMPGSLTGVQTVTKLREYLRQDVPAILITGDIEIKKLQDVQDSAIPFLHKPIQAGKLRTLMQYLVFPAKN